MVQQLLSNHQNWRLAKDNKQGGGVATTTRGYPCKEVKTMQTLISAPPRTGKSLYCMSLIDQLSRKHPNRRIYTNIIGMNYPGVLTINSTPEKPFDWRDLPDGSIIFFDEAHEHPAFSAQDLLGTARTDAEKKRKAEILDIGDSLTLHGHFGFDIYLITQNPKL